MGCAVELLGEVCGCCCQDGVGLAQLVVLGAKAFEVVVVWFAQEFWALASFVFFGAYPGAQGLGVDAHLAGDVGDRLVGLGDAS
jgi:hypothetical protein